MRNSNADIALPGFEHSLAVVIGINSYDHGIPPLLNAVRDANAVADTLERQGFEVLRLLDSQATLSALSQLLTHHLPSLPHPPDRLLLYFAGHGLAHTDDQHQLSGFLLPSDARRDDLSSYWPMASLREALRHLPCRHLLLILDCCFAGAFPHSPSRDIRAPSLPAPLFLERFRHFSSRRSFQLLLSTAHDELASDRLLAKPSQESLGDGLHSPFALTLLEALQPLSPADTNQDGLITAAELYTFLRDRLVSLLPSHCQQTPALWHLDWHDGGEFLFLLSDSFPALPPAAPLSQRSNPYLGLRPFSSAHRHLFFGRERLVDSLLERLRAQPLLLLCGPSGAGKSSLVHAGLLPRLTEDSSWRVPPSLRPSSQPLHALSSWLASLAPNTEAPSAAVLASRPRSAAEFLSAFLARHAHLSVLLVIDPLEELVTACLDDSLRRAFLRALSGLLQLSHPRLHLLLLLRSDFEPHFLSLLQPSALPSALWHGGRLHLPPMNRDELRRCIEKPAEACVLFFSPGLVERLLDDVEQMPGALPLLSVALSELFGAYLGSGRDDRTLSFEDYHHIGGGIAGALQRRAELVFSGMPPPASEGQPSLAPVPSAELPAFQRTLRNVLLRMVSPEGGELARRRVPRSELEYSHREENARVQRALRTLEASRLVVASDDGGPCVEPAHDALLSAWPRLHDWARHAQRELLLLRRISHAAAEWHRHRHATDFLWADARLDQLGLAPNSLRRADVPLALLTAAPGSQPTEPLGFNAAESGFLRTSATRRRVLRTRRNALTITVAMALVALTVAAFFQAAKANENALEAQFQQRAAEASEQDARTQKEAAEAHLQEAQKQQRLANTNAQEAQRQKTAAETHLREARKQQEAADASAREALAQKNTAEANSREAQQQKEAADANAREALSQRNNSERNAQEARKQQEAAEANAKEARKQQQLADTNAQEARTQQEVAEANFKEARKHQEAADLSAREAQRQQETAEANAREAGRQQQLADANAREALAQRNAAETNAREARMQQEAADASAQEAQRQKDLAMTSSRLAHVERLIAEDPTKALLVLLEGASWLESPDNPWLQTASSMSQRDLSSAILVGHSDAITSIAFSPDGSRVLTASDDGTTRIWRTDGSGTPIVFTDSQQAPVISATFSPDGTHVLTVSKNGSARIWRTDNPGTPVTLEEQRVQVTSAAFSPDGSRVLTLSNDGNVRIWRTDNFGPPSTLEVQRAKVRSATFSPDNLHVLTVCSDGAARIWRTDNPGTPVILENQQAEVRSATFSPDGSHVLTTSTDEKARSWPTNGSGPPIVLAEAQDWLISATFSPDGSRIATISSDGNARIWHADNPGNPIVLDNHPNQATSVTFSPDSSHVLTTSNDGNTRIWNVDGSGTPIVLAGTHNATFSPNGAHVLTASGDGITRIWRTDGSMMLHTLAGHTLPVTAIFSPDGSRVLTASSDGIARVWRIGGPGSFLFDSHINFEIFQNILTSAAISPDGSRVLTASAGGIAHVWRLDGSGEPLILDGHTDAVVSATFSPNGSHVLTASLDKTARIWRADGHDDPLVLDAHTDWVHAATFSFDGSHVLTASSDGTARIWRADGLGDPIILDHEDGSWVNSATFSPDGSRVLTTSLQLDSSTRTARIWRVGAPGDPLVLGRHTDQLWYATFSPDGSHVLAASEDETARIWRADGSNFRVLKGHTNAVTTRNFSPDGSRVLTASNDGIARIWRVDGAGTPIELTGHTRSVKLTTFSPDGSRVLTAASDDTVRIWRTDERTPFFLMHHKGLMDAFFLPNGSHVVTVSQDGTVRIWPIAPASLRHFLSQTTTACLSVHEREQYLLEPETEAREGHERCERSHGRLP